MSIPILFLLNKPPINRSFKHSLAKTTSMFSGNRCDDKSLGLCFESSAGPSSLQNSPGAFWSWKFDMHSNSNSVLGQFFPANPISA